MSYNALFPRVAKLASGLLVLACAGEARALELELEPMVGAEFTWMRAEIADESYGLPAARLRLALGLTPDWEIGITGGAGLDSDEKETVSLELGSFQSAYVRYSAPLDDNARLVLSLGYGQFTLDAQAVATPGLPGSEDYSGLVWGLSLQERLANHPHWIGSLDFERWFDEDGLRVDTLSYGFRYAF